MQSTRASPPAQAIIFDLDNCLVPGDAIGPAAYDPAFEAIREANNGTLSDAELSAAFAEMWRHSVDDVARRHGFSPGMLEAGWSVFRGWKRVHPWRVMRTSARSRIFRCPASS